MQAAYDELAEVYAQHFPGTEPEAAVDLAMLDHLVLLATEHAGGPPEILDAGCGTGRIGRYLTDRGCRVRGVDLSPGMIAVAGREHPDLDVQVGSITGLPFPEDVFDAAVFWYSTIHGDDATLAAALGEAARVLRAGGLVLVGFQVGDEVIDLGERMRARGLEVRRLPRHHRTPDHVALALAGAGFVEVARLVRAPIGEQEPQAVLIGHLQS